MASPLIRADDSSLQVRDIVGDNNEVYFARIALNFNGVNPELKETLEKALTEIMHEKLIDQVPVQRQVLAVEGAVDGLALYHPLKELERALEEKEVKDMIEMYCMACQVEPRPASAYDLFASMIHRGKLRFQDFTFLQSLLWKAGRRDLFKKMAEKARSLQELHKNDNPPLRICHLDAPSLVPIEGYMYIKFHLKVDLLDIGSERLRKLEGELARFLGVPQEYIAVMGVEPDQSAWVTLIMPAVACEFLKLHVDEGPIQNFLGSLDIDKVGFFPDPGEGADGGCVSRAADPDPKPTGDETTLMDEGDATRSSATVLDKLKVPNYFEGDEYYFGYPRRGCALIINNMKFVGLPDRPSSRYDVDLLKKVFQKLGFYVKIYQDIHADKMREVLQNEAKADHSEEDCFVCAVLTHGGEMFADKTRKADVLLGTDGKAVRTEELLHILSDENCPSLGYKPRLFFIQACRGEKTDPGQAVDVYEDKKTEEQGATGEDDADPGDPAGEKDEAGGTSLSLSRDFLVAYGTTPGHYAFRRSKGSWFVWSLHKAVMEAQGDVSLMDVLTRAANIQAREFESSSKKAEYDAKKTVSHITHTLTKDVIFRPKEGTATGP